MTPSKRRPFELYLSLATELQRLLCYLLLQGAPAPLRRHASMPVHGYSAAPTPPQSASSNAAAPGFLRSPRASDAATGTPVHALRSLHRHRMSANISHISGLTETDEMATALGRRRSSNSNGLMMPGFPNMDRDSLLFGN